MRTILLSLACLLTLLAPGTGAAQDQPAIITGRVTVLDSVAASAGVLVRIESALAGVLTDSTGQYRLVVPARRIGTDSVDLVASRTAITPGRRRVLLTPGREIRADFDLKVNRLESLSTCAHAVYGGTRPLAESVKLCSMSRLLGQKAGGSGGPR